MMHLLIFSISLLYNCCEVQPDAIHSYNELNILPNDSTYLLNDSIYVMNDSLKTSLKDPFLAGFYSFIVPGFAIGQLYNKDYLNWGIRFGVSATCLGVSYALLDSKKAPGIVAVCLLVYSINWVSSIFNASDRANEINSLKKYKRKKN